ncbi:hypothetical protein TraAM80_06384 [Trypanosoma rangeli]|uniref:Pleckstrin homology domain-containing protein n=1 Tax=Trypanosoma rangeli TaxID=5698 RepID=A0A422NAI8_TRYRA|nr:uncharacterized protein TraAM80_06384 [Trypanosoma rangeli]RNF02487.1 hypothetical protein TraAM80_06384 [Trypanosoma rangeli]|eukprot:RNF02487.1 hypothetical protein TraAM80_06384 [Trypanosoma rangeli]
MDSLHEAHLERILENRRRRGVVVSHGNRCGPSTATQTGQWEVTGSGGSPTLTKPDLSPNPRAALSYSATDATEPCENAAQATRAAVVTGPGNRRDGLENEGFNQGWPNLGGNAAERDTGLCNQIRSPRFGTRDGGNFGRNCRRWSNENLLCTWRPLRTSSAFCEDTSSFVGNGTGFCSARSPRRTVPLLTYGVSDASPSWWCGGGSRRGRTVSLRPPSSWHSGTRSFQRQPGYRHRDVGDSRQSYSRGRHGETRSYGRYDSSLRHYMGGPRGVLQMSAQRFKPNRAAEFLCGSPTERNWQAAGTVIYTGNGTKDEWNPFVSLQQRRRPPGSPLPQGASVSGANRDSMAGPTKDVVGLPSTRTTIDICTSVSILAAGDWFYKWGGNGAAVSPRWVWVDAQTHLLLWAHKETYESAFAGAIKLEKILHVDSRELQYPSDDGIPRTYHVLLVETTKRVLQLATERRIKADTWYEALTNVVLYLRSHNFGVPSAYSAP